VPQWDKIISSVRRAAFLKLAKPSIDSEEGCLMRPAGRPICKKGRPPAVKSHGSASRLSIINGIHKFIQAAGNFVYSAAALRGFGTQNKTRMLNCRRQIGRHSGCEKRKKFAVIKSSYHRLVLPTPTRKWELGLAGILQCSS